jgi:hypothetical protein
MDAVVAYIKIFSGFVVGETEENINQFIQLSGRGSYQVPSEHNEHVMALPLHESARRI